MQLYMKICCWQQFYFYPILLLYLHNVSRSRHFQVPLGDSSSGDLFLGDFCSLVLDKWIIFIAFFMGIVPSGATTLFSCVFLFLGFLSLAPIGLPRFKCALDSFAATLINFPSGTSILSGVLAAGMWDFTILLLLVNISGNWFARPYKWIILWTSSSHCFVRGSKWDNVEAFHMISRRASGFNFSPPNYGKTISLKWQSSKHALKTSQVRGSRYLMINGESKPI